MCRSRRPGRNGPTAPDNRCTEARVGILRMVVPSAGVVALQTVLPIDMHRRTSHKIRDSLIDLPASGIVLAPCVWWIEHDVAWVDPPDCIGVSNIDGVKSPWPSRY